MSTITTNTFDVIGPHAMFFLSYNSKDYFAVRTFVTYVVIMPTSL